MSTTAQSKMFGLPGRYGGTPTETPVQTPSQSPASTVPPTPQSGAGRHKASDASSTAAKQAAMVVDRGGPTSKPRVAGEYGLDSNIADIVAKRGRAPPSLKYLQYGVASTHGQSFSYSEEMLDALGERKTGNGPARPDDMASPWAVEPDELHEPVKSLYGKDYEGKQLNNAEPGSRATELADRSKALKSKIERKRSEGRDAMMNSGIGSPKRRSVVKSGTPASQSDGTVKMFDHSGVYRRPISTPLKEQINDIKEQSQQKRRNTNATTASNTNASPSGAQAIPDICNPLLGGESIFAWNPNSVAMSVEQKQKAEAGGEDREKSSKKSSSAKAPTAFWYPKDRQLQKHQRLENQRWEEGGSNLQKNGWDTTTIVGLREKKVSNPEFQTTLTQDEQAKVDAQLDSYRLEVERNKIAKKERQALSVQQQREKEAALALKKTRSRNSRGVLGGLASLDDSQFTTTTGDYGARANSTTPGYGELEVRGPLHVPDPGFRAELPGARVPTGLEKEQLLQRLSLPPAETRHGSKGGDSSPAPPWGRPTAQDERYAEVKVYSTRNKKLNVVTHGKMDIDRELRVVRDGGLQKKAKTSLLKTVDPEQLKYIKQMGNAAMRQTRNPPSSL